MAETNLTHNNESDHKSRLFDTCNDLEDILSMSRPLLDLLSESTSFDCGDKERALEAQGRIVRIDEGHKE